MRERLYALFRQELQPIPGVAETLADARVPFCVASSSQLERIRLSLEVTGLVPFFGEHIFSASMVAHGKPAPDLFLHAARDDACRAEPLYRDRGQPSGRRSGEKRADAGLRLYGRKPRAIAGPSPALTSLEPTLVFDDMAALPGLIAA